MLLMGIEQTIFMFISSIPFFFIKSNYTNKIVFAYFIDCLKGINLLYTIGFFLSSFFHQAFVFIIVDRFSPSHLPLGIILYSFLNNIFKIIKNKVIGREIEYFVYLNFAIYIILFIAAMIHNEIFIINRCGLNSNTKLFLDYKLDQEKKENEILPTNIEYYSYDIQFAKEDEKLIPLEDVSSKD